MSDEFDKYLNSKIGQKNKNLDILHNFFNKNELKTLQERSVAIVGTNGKTSCAYFLNEILINNSVSTCMFTSPHLVRLNERIKNNNKEISDNELSFYLEQLYKFEEENNIQLGYFEILFLIACKYFIEMNLDIFIVEAGIGGMYDTTSIINTDTVCITNVGFDHTELLGETLDEIFIQKIKISKNPKKLIFGEFELYERHKDFIQNNFNIDKDSIYFDDKSMLKNSLNDYEMLNFSTSIKVFDAISHLLDKENNINYSLVNVKKVPGRFEILSVNPLKIIDGAHNIDSLNALLDFASQNSDIENIDIYVGMKKDKDSIRFIERISKEEFSNIYLIENNSFFAQEDKKVFEDFLKLNNISFNIGSIQDFYLSKNPSILTGSLYLVGKYKKEYT